MRSPMRRKFEELGEYLANHWLDHSDAYEAVGLNSPTKFRLSWMEKAYPRHKVEWADEPIGLGEYPRRIVREAFNDALAEHPAT